MDVSLRSVHTDDLPYFFEHQCDRAANHMAAFTSENPLDRSAFDRHWNRITTDPRIAAQTIMADRTVAGHILCHRDFGEPEVSYWIERSLWGRGVATAALSAFLSQVSERPLYARVAADNAASIKVLDRCGFVQVGTDTGFAHGRGAEVAERILRHD